MTEGKLNAKFGASKIISRRMAQLLLIERAFKIAQFCKAKYKKLNELFRFS
jgi:hypothetical protein